MTDRSAIAPPLHLVEDLSGERRATRSEAVVEALRGAILRGELADGERLIEDRIARDLNTSRGPVREALRQLVHEGFAVSYPYRGAVVLGVSDEEVQQVLVPVRLVLERFTFPIAANLMGDDDFAELAKEIWQMREAGKTADVARSVEADMRFHELMLERANQPHTAQVWGSIAPRIRAYFYRYGRQGNLERIADEHEHLLSAFQTRDRATIVAALEAHIAVAPISS
ncbi:MAG: GntR family transcriptional regulator [Actinobacteria bacterium]|nr:GntR family transcriptional regulator [Actinomycetota bacterium]